MTNSDRSRDEFGDDVVSDTVGEILLLQIPAHIGEGQHGDRGFARLRQIVGSTIRRTRPNGTRRGFDGTQQERLNRSADVLQLERAKIVEGEIKSVAHMITHPSRNTDGAWRAFGLKPRRHIDRVAVQIRAIGNRVAKVDSDAEADDLIGGTVAV